MAEDIENNTLRLLPELRTEMREMRDDLTNRIDGNTLILNMVAGIVHDHEKRVEGLEDTAGQ